MFKILKYIEYAFKAKKGIHKPDEVLSETSFSFIEGFFILSFIFLGLIVIGLGFVAFYYTSKVALIFSILFLFSLFVDIWIFIKIKKFFRKMSEKIVSYSKNRYREFNSENIIDVE